MASGFQTWSQTAASNATADDNIGWAEGQAPSSVNDSARSMMAVLAKHRDDVAGTLTTGGTSTAYTLTTNTVFSSASGMNGQTIRVRFHVTNGASPVLNVDSQSAAAPIRVGSNGSAVQAGALFENSIYDLTYNSGNNEWILVGVYAVVATDAVATSAIQNNAVSNAKLRDSGANSVIGRATNSSGDPADISASTDGHVLRLSGTTLGFGTTATAGIADNAVTFGKLATAVKASASDQETGTSSQTFVSPDVQHRHQSAAKAWGVFAGSSGSLQAGYNCSVVRNTTGEYAVSFSANLSSDAYAPTVTLIDTSNIGVFRCESQSTAGFTITTRNMSSVNTDFNRVSFHVFGDI